MMSKEDVKNFVNDYNDAIDKHIKEKFNLNENSKIDLAMWVKVNEYKQQQILPLSMNNLTMLRHSGYDVKIDMQSYKLVF